MQVAGRKVIRELAAKHADVAEAVYAWLSEAEEAEWKNPVDIKSMYSHASILPGNRVIFNLKGNKYRLEVKVSYQTGVVLIMRAGTHAEYSRWNT